MTTYKSRADLLIAAGESIKMQEAAGCRPVGKYEGRVDFLSNYSWDSGLEEYELPLAVVEGKAVFVGDELYDIWGNTCKANHIADSWYGVPSMWSKDRGCFAHLNECTWLPPKPKTVMVELTIDAAKYLVATNTVPSIISKACFRALEQNK